MKFFSTALKAKGELLDLKQLTTYCYSALARPNKLFPCILILHGMRLELIVEQLPMILARIGTSRTILHVFKLTEGTMHPGQLLMGTAQQINSPIL
jgi:hypothetical protein